MSRREIDRQAGWTENYLSQILRGASDLKMVHVVEALRILRIEPGEFFRHTFKSAEEDSLDRRLNDLKMTVRQHGEKLKELERRLKHPQV